MARVLADGSKMPLLGLGVWQIPDGPECVDAVRWALEAGYRLIDTAQGYRNEASVGQALRDSGLDRGQVFITTKFLPRSGDPVSAVEQSLRRLGTDYVDLYLIHWPEGGPTWAWPGMERAAGLGYARSIGVSNFGEAELESVAATANLLPAVNQVNFNPFVYRRALHDACQRRNIALEAYSPLGTGRHLSDPTVAAIAIGIARTPAQVLLRWSVQRGIPVISKSTHQDRIKENRQIFDFDLTDEAMSRLDALDQTGGTGRALEHKWW
jgi:2,5-diketo-D-gluconate reductase A